jgi:hypothetical protein
MLGIKRCRGLGILPAQKDLLEKQGGIKRYDMVSKPAAGKIAHGTKLIPAPLGGCNVPLSRVACS